MRKKTMLRALWVMWAFCLIPSVVLASEGAAVAGAPVMRSQPSLEVVRKTIVAQVATVKPDWVLLDIKPSAIEGLYEARFQNGLLAYISADGRYILDGELYAIRDGDIISMTEESRKIERAPKLAAIARKDMVIFSPPPPQATKAALYVFTDVDCGYCQKLHSEVPLLNAMGIEVRYLAWPRAGFDSDTYRKMVTIWCANGAERNTLMTRYKNREAVPLNVCEDNPVAAQFRLGQELGVSGTPALILEDGQLQPGYLPADRLAPLVIKASAEARAR